jgi:hypothetical protein
MNPKSNARSARPFARSLAGIHPNHLEIAGFILYNLGSWIDPGGRGIYWIDLGA